MGEAGGRALDPLGGCAHAFCMEPTLQPLLWRCEPLGLLPASPSHYCYPTPPRGCSVLSDLVISLIKETALGLLRQPLSGEDEHMAQVGWGGWW